MDKNRNEINPLKRDDLGRKGIGPVSKNFDIPKALEDTLKRNDTKGSHHLGKTTSHRVFVLKLSVAKRMHNEIFAYRYKSIEIYCAILDSMKYIISKLLFLQ